MPFDWLEYRLLAQWLFGQSPPGPSRQAVLRCVVSRLYYAAFGYLLTYACERLGYVRAMDRAVDHGRLPAYLRRHRHGAVASHLQNLRDWRNICDYDGTTTEDFEVMAASAFDAIDDILRRVPPAP